MNIARIITNLSLDKSFDYSIPSNLVNRISIGSMVKVPFGKSSRKGFVIDLPQKSDYPDLKEIDSIIGNKPMISSPLVELGKWMADYYCCTKEQAIIALLPAAVRGRLIKEKTRKIVRVKNEAEIPIILQSLNKKASKQADVLRFLLKNKEYPLSKLVKEHKISYPAIRTMEAKNYILISDETQARDPFANDRIIPTSPLNLNTEQSNAFNKVVHSINSEKKDVILLFGVTGSGKTEIYLQGIAECLKLNLESIVLVPEIALTPQTTERFRSRFGDQVSVLHSHLSAGERFDEWNKINNGQVKIVVGARSALFAPFRNLGLIIVDEEHETSYKQGNIPRYHARDVAVMRGKLENITVILGTATPSVESFYNAKKGKYNLLTLSQRIENQQLPEMNIVDLTVENAEKERYQIFSRRLITEIRDALENGEQVMLFLNRRGYATQLQCLKCDFVAECSDCTMNFTYHKSRSQLICHLCGSVTKAPEKCPECGDKGIRFSGLGTEKIEASIKGKFPYARSLRMDSDTMTKKDSYRQALTSFRAGEIDILIGTQMIAKGLHFPNVTVVGIIFADQSLNLTDFRAGERAFQLLVQVAGRSGRGDLPGRVIVQTYTPCHPILMSAIDQDYELFFEKELESRMQLKLPPIEHLLLLSFKGENDDEVRTYATYCFELLKSKIPTHINCSPVLPSPILKKRGLYTYQILMCTEKIMVLSKYIKQFFYSIKSPKKITVTIDVDPYSLL